MSDEFSWLIDRFIGPFLGVLSAFILNYAYQWFRDGKEKSKYRSAFRSEIKHSVERLQAGLGQLLPNVVWTAAVNAGALRLFCSSQAIRLSQVYFAIQNYNYEAIRTRDMAERSRAEANISHALDVTCQERDQMGKGLKDTLRSLLEEEWFKDQSP